jgi:phage baseplate assembly protein W
MSDSMGIDLMVVPNFVAHDAASVDLSPRVRRRPGVAPLGEPDPIDAATILGRENLAQALILRLLTPVGSLAALGHATYGSQLHRLIGRRKTPELRNLCRAYVLEAVAQEPRVAAPVVTLDFDPAAETSASFVFTVAVQPAGGSGTVGLSLEVGL